MMDENNSELGICAVCGRNEAVAVIHSGLGPTSSAQCQECQDRGARAMIEVHMFIADRGGREVIDEISDFGASLISYDEGQYVGWQRICSLYKEREAEILAIFGIDVEDIDEKTCDPAKPT